MQGFVFPARFDRVLAFVTSAFLAVKIFEACRRDN